jgi:hypothetical protein
MHPQPAARTKTIAALFMHDDLAHLSRFVKECPTEVGHGRRTCGFDFVMAIITASRA